VLEGFAQGDLELAGGGDHGGGVLVAGAHHLGEAKPNTGFDHADVLTSGGEHIDGIALDLEFHEVAGIE